MAPTKPCYVLLRKAAYADLPFLVAGMQARAEAGVHLALLNRNMAVSVLATNGTTLGLRPHEFVWCDADGRPRVLPPDPAVAAVWADLYANWTGYRDRYNELARGIPGAEPLP